MSTKIEDLPGPIPDDVLGDINLIKNDQMYIQEENSRQSHQSHQGLQDHRIESKEENHSNIKMNVKKRVRFENDEDNMESFENNKEESVFSFLKNLLSEENALLFILFLLSSQTDFDRYPRSIPYLGAYIENPLIFTTIKCLLLVLCFVVTKKFVLPRIKL
jgi:hypothetical protein